MADAATEPGPVYIGTSGTGLPVVFLGLPHAGQMCPESMVSLGMASNDRFEVQLEARGSSLLACNFNGLWAEALNANPRPKYFAMHHSDIAAPPGWLDKLIDTLEREGADMVSACVAIKDFSGLTSTALLDLEKSARRRLTVAETLKLPKVFSAADVGRLYDLPHPEKTALLVNTGLWVCRFAGQNWIEGARFHTGDDVRLDPDGRYRAHVFPEDWLWSAELAARGLVVLASRELHVVHYGRTPFAIGANTKAWGGLEGDGWVDT